MFQLTRMISRLNDFHYMEGIGSDLFRSHSGTMCTTIVLVAFSCALEKL